jgi:hypothetical protein
MNWNNLTDLGQLDEITISNDKPVAILHSTRCSVSRMALKQFENELTSNKVTPYFRFNSISMFLTKFQIVLECTINLPINPIKEGKLTV